MAVQGISMAQVPLYSCQGLDFSVLSQLVWLCYFRRLAHLSDQMPGTGDQRALLDSLWSFPQASPVGAVIALRMLAGMIM